MRQQSHVLFLGPCEAGTHSSCPTTWTSAGTLIQCECPCHGHEPQAQAIVNRLRRSGIRPGTVADLIRFQERIAGNNR